MEKPHQEYRDELAEKLKGIRNSDSENPEIAKAKAQGYLDSQRETKEYMNAKENHKKEVVDYIMENSTAEERLDTVWSEIKNPSFTREQLLEALKAIDNLYEVGYLVGYSVVGIFRNKEYVGSMNEYNYDAMETYILQLEENLKGVVKDQYSLPQDSSHIDRIFACGGEHYHGFHPSEYDCSKGFDRGERIKIFLKKFRKSADQIEKEQEEKRLQKEKEQEEKRERKEKADFEKFDPSI